MSGLRKCDERTWDAFFDHLASSVDHMSMAEVREELRLRGISTEKAFSKVKLAIESSAAQNRLADARARRMSVLDQIMHARKGGAISFADAARELISRVNPQLQPVYFRKLQSVASEEDKWSLLEDLERLDVLSEQTPDESSQGA